MSIDPLDLTLLDLRLPAATSVPEGKNFERIRRCAVVQKVADPPEIEPSHARCTCAAVLGTYAGLFCKE